MRVCERLTRGDARRDVSNGRLRLISQRRGDAEAAFETVDVDAYDALVVPSPVIHVTSVTDRVMEHSKSHPRMLKSTLRVTRSERRDGGTRART